MTPSNLQLQGKMNKASGFGSSRNGRMVSNDHKLAEKAVTLWSVSPNFQVKNGIGGAPLQACKSRDPYSHKCDLI